MNDREHMIAAIGELFFEFQAKLQFFEREYLKKLDITDVTPNEVKVLYMVGTSNTKSMSEIAERLKITRGSLSITIDSLVKKGYVIRTRNKQDRRIIIVYLTRKSIFVVRGYGKFYYNLLSNLIEQLTPEKGIIVKEMLEELNTIIETDFYDDEEEYMLLSESEDDNYPDENSLDIKEEEE